MPEVTLVSYEMFDMYLGMLIKCGFIYILHFSKTSLDAMRL